MPEGQLSSGEVNKRVDTCLELRYNSERPMLQREWIAYCHEHYGDKSEQQYHYYWAKASERYTEGWKAKLEGMLDPAMRQLVELLYSEDEKVVQRAIDQIVKYTGNDVEKQEIDITVRQIETQWG
jgi:hypothetical protein